jgi:hypothetical protein
MKNVNQYFNDMEIISIIYYVYNTGIMDSS